MLPYKDDINECIMFISTKEELLPLEERRTDVYLTNPKHPVLFYEFLD